MLDYYNQASQLVAHLQLDIMPLELTDSNVTNYHQARLMTQSTILK